MPQPAPANRDDELSLFRQMVSGQSEQRILLLAAAGGMGKTTLLHEFIRRCPPNLTCVPIDLKGSSIGLHQIFNRLCDELGWANFPTFRAKVEGLQQVNITDNTIIGRAEIEVALRSPDEGNRSARRAELTRAFFDDLRARPRPVLIIFDTFEQASLEVQEWLQSSFLAFARGTPDLILVVAGREVPTESIDWASCCISRRLTPIEDHVHWRSYCQNTGLTLHEEAVKALCTYLKGRPDKIAQALLAVAGPGGS